MTLYYIVRTTKPKESTMLRNTEKDQKETGFALRLFDSKNPSHIEALNVLIEAEIAQKDEDNKPLEKTFENMTEWLKKYVNSPDFLKLYSDSRSLELMAEATFWSVKLGLDTHLAKMTYREIREFHPLEERFGNKTERSILIDEVCKKLVKPAWSHEASFALGQAAWCVHVHNNSFKKLKEEEQLYDSPKASSPKIG